MASALLAVTLGFISVLNGYHCIVGADRVNRNTSRKIKSILTVRILFSAGLFIWATCLI
jgi:hypothetical protein